MKNKIKKLLLLVNLQCVDLVSPFKSIMRTTEKKSVFNNYIFVYVQVHVQYMGERNRLTFLQKKLRAQSSKYRKRPVELMSLDDL